MAGVMKRMKLVVEAKANAALERREDPAELLDLSYAKQLELLAQVRRGVADVATSRKRLEIQMDKLRKEADTRSTQARRALEVGREDLAREALLRRAPVQQQLDDMTTQYNALHAEEERLTSAAQNLQMRVDAFRTKKETIKAQYAAAQATTRIGEAFSGISEEMGDVNLAIERAEEKTRTLQARGAALEELTAAGVLDDPMGLGKDNITRELEALSAGPHVESEMARLKNEIADTSANRKQIGAGSAEPAGA